MCVCVCVLLAIIVYLYFYWNNRKLADTTFLPKDIYNMNWDSADKSHFDQLTQSNQGQIGTDSRIGAFLAECAQNPEYVSYLEVGTWNGLGSTRCFIDGFAKREQPFVFYSLECHPEKSELARKRYEHIPNVHILNEVLTNQITEQQVREMFPVLERDARFAYWNRLDLAHMKNKKVFLERPEIPEVFDVILLDGGEFVTWFEYLCIRDRCRVLALDDTRTFKCAKIVEELKNNPDWEMVFESHERNGTAAFRKTQK